MLTSRLPTLQYFVLLLCCGSYLSGISASKAEFARHRLASHGGIALQDTERPVEESAALVPGVTVSVYPEFFAKASRVAVRLLQENFRKARLDSASAVAHVPVVGDFKIKLEDVHLERLDVNKTSTGVSLGRDGSLVLHVTGLNAIVTGHLRWRRTQFPFISGGCQADVTAEAGTVVLRVRVVEDADGRPAISDVRAAELSFDSISIHTSGAKLAWLYNAVAAFAKTPLQEAITKEVAAQVTTTIPGIVDSLLAGLPTTVEVKGLELNVSLATDPSVSTDKLVIQDWGRFQNPEDHWQECPFARQIAEGGAAFLPTGAPYMLVANLDESVANCLTWDLYKKGMLKHFFVGDDLPQRALYTSTWRFVIPALYNRCPDCPLALQASVTSPPRTHFDASKGITTSGTAELAFYLADNSGHSEVSISEAGSMDARALLEDTSDLGGVGVGAHMFTLSLAGELTVPELRLESDPERPDGFRLFLSMKINQTALAVDVVRSDIGNINKAALHVALTVGAFLVEDQVNHGILKDGFPLPDIPHIAVTRANVSVGDALLAFGSDLSYAA